MISVSIIEVIKTVSQVGNNSKTNPLRETIHYWLKDGSLLSVKDRFMDSTRECKGCVGTGNSGGEECSHCSGTGRMSC